MRFLYPLLILILFSSCDDNQEKNNFNGQWEILDNGKLKSIITINNDSILLHTVFNTKCDTHFTKKEGFNFLKPHIKNEKLLLSFYAESDTSNFNISISQKDNTGELCHKSNQKCFTIKRSNHKLSYILTNEKKLKFILAKQINEYKASFEILKKETILNSEATLIIQNIDTLKIELMKEYDKDYSSITCWHKLDSLSSYETSSDFIIGEDPASPKDNNLSGYHLEKMLLQYLINQSKKIDVSIIFSEYRSGNIDIYYLHGGAKPWAIDKFYHMPLGSIISELNRTQVRIVQLEKIIQLNHK
tara:strand:- start:2013 stop:2918 length:906 start_codon:yes stop_codon:yes gene_type:complete